jgi:hypothetical protein
MRTLALMLLLAACSDPSVPEDSVALTSAISVVGPFGTCTSSDLRLYSDANFRGTRLCLRGIGYFNDIPSYLPNGFHSVRVGIFPARFQRPGITVDMEDCHSYSTVNPVISPAYDVLIQLAPSPQPCP